MWFCVTAAFAVVLVAISIRPVREFGLLHRPLSHNSDACRVLNASSFAGLEDITIVHEDDAAVDIIGAFEPRRETWLNHDFVQTQPLSVATGLVHIRVHKRSCAGAVDRDGVPGGGFTDCVQVLPLPVAPIMDAASGEAVNFAPHGIFFDRGAGGDGRLLVVNHAHRFGGERIESFRVVVGAAAVPPSLPSLRVEHLESILLGAAGAWPPHDFTLGVVTRGNEPSAAGSLIGALNDLAIERVNNRIVSSQWKANPVHRDFPRHAPFVEENLMKLLVLVTDSSTVVSCPTSSEASTQQSNGNPHQQYHRQQPQPPCVRAAQRFGLSNGVATNREGDIVVVVDFIHGTLTFMRPLQVANHDDRGRGVGSGGTVLLPAFHTLGAFATRFPGDNLELYSQNETAICFSLSIVQRLIEPTVLVFGDPLYSTSTGASLVCCPHSSGISPGDTGGHGDAGGDAGSTVRADACVEEVLFLDAGTSHRAHSAVSSALVIDASSWAGREEAQRLVLTGSWLDGGLGVCWV
jgi:hypothetical protein